MYAAEQSNYEACKMLLEAGADATIHNYKGKDVVSIAKQVGDPEILALFGLEASTYFRTDGPYFLVDTDSSFLYVSVEQKKDSFFIDSKTVNEESLYKKWSCKTDEKGVFNSFTFSLEEKSSVPQSQWDSLPPQVYVVSNIKGSFFTLRTFLIDNQIMDLEKIKTTTFCLSTSRKELQCNF